MQLTIPFRLRPFVTVALCAAAALMLTACTAPSAGPSLVSDAKLKGNDADAQLEFWHDLDGRPMTTHNDAFHGLLLYLDGKDDSADYAARVSALKARKILPESFNRPADEAIQRGTMAVIMVKMLDLKGGVMLTLLGPTPRYAVRELQAQGLYPLSTPNQIFSGSEYVGIIGKIEDYQRGNPANKPASEMPGN